MNRFAIERVREFGAKLAVVLGSGLNSLGESADRDQVIAYSEIEGLPRASVKGHPGRLVLTEIGGLRAVFARGRVHLYEGYRAREVTAGIRFLARAGIEKRVSPHWMRHAHASHALDRSAPIHLVQATLGHASVSTTGRYLHARPNESSSFYLPD